MESQRSPDEENDIRELLSSDPAYRCAHAGYLLMFLVLAGYFLAVRQGCIKLPLPSTLSTSPPSSGLPGR
jgi:hypothetical protein